MKAHSPATRLDCITLYADGLKLLEVANKMKEVYGTAPAKSTIFMWVVREGVLRTKPFTGAKRVFKFLDSGQPYSSIKQIAFQCNTNTNIAYKAHIRWKKRAKAVHPQKL